MRIESYINDDKISVKDKLIGTDGDKSNETKNFTITGISDFILAQLKHSGVVFRFSDGATEGLEIGEPGYFFSEQNIVDKPTVTKFYFSTASYFGEELAELFASVGSNLGDLYLGLSQMDDSANYGFFNVANIVNINDEYFEIEASLRGNMFAKSFVPGKNYSLFFDLASSNEFDIDIIGGIFNLYKNGALHKQVNMSVYMDDTNLARLIGGTVDEFGLATFKRDDDTFFTVDFADFFGGVMATKTSHLINDGEDGSSPFVMRKDTYNKSEVDNKDLFIQQQVTKLNGLYLQRDEATSRIYLRNSEGTALSWIPDNSMDGAGYKIEFDANSRTIYIIDSQGNIVDSLPISILNQDKLDRGGYSGTAQTLKDEIDAINNQPSTTPETEIKEFNEGHISGYEYNSTAKWVFGGVAFTKTQPITLAPADPVYDRIDIWVCDNLGGISVITGNPGANPVEPSYDPNIQIKAKLIIIPAGSTGPTGVSKIVGYLENAQVAGGEMNTSENTAGARINLGSGNQFFSGAKSIEATALLTFNSFTLTPGAPLSVVGITSIGYRIKNKPGVYTHANPLSVRLTGTRSNGRIGHVFLAAAWQFGYDKGDSATWQFVSIPFPAKLDIVDITEITFINNVSSSEGFGFFIDEIMLSNGEENTGGGTTGVDKAYVDSQDAAILASAKAHADAGDTSTLQAANAYAESLVDGFDPTIDHQYTTIADMIAGQNDQLEDEIIKVLDASGDGITGRAYYFYNGTIAGTIEDYTALTSSEVQALTAQAITAALGYPPVRGAKTSEGNQLPVVDNFIMLPESTGSEEASVLLFHDTFENGPSVWNDGGGEYDTSGPALADTGTSVISTDVAYNGTRSLKMTATHGLNQSGQTNNTRYAESQTYDDLIYDFQVFIPVAIDVANWTPQTPGFLNFTQIKARGVNQSWDDPMWVFDLLPVGGPGNGVDNLRFKLSFFGDYFPANGITTRTEYQPDQIIGIPIGQWCNIKLRYYKHPTNGIIQLWQDGVKLFDLQNVHTKPTRTGFDWTYWSVNNYGNSTTPATFSLYVDDVKISTNGSTVETPASIRTKYLSNAGTEELTTTLKGYYDAAYNWVTTNGANILSRLGVLEREPIIVSTSRLLTSNDHKRKLLIIANVTLTWPAGGINPFECNFDIDATGQLTIADQAATAGNDLDAPDGKILEAGKMAHAYKRPENIKLRLKGSWKA